jgi:hypothetical protein
VRRDHAEDGVAEELEPLVRFQTAPGPLVDVRGVDQRRLQQLGVTEGIAQRPAERGCN